jgi:hypothetical protein
MARKTGKYLITDRTAAKTVTENLEEGQTISVTGTIGSDTIALNHIDPGGNVMGSVYNSAGVALTLSATSPAYTVEGPFRIQIVKGITTGAAGVWLEG